MKAVFASVVVAGFLAACGGGGGGEAVAIPAGYWSNDDGAVLITKDGEVWGITSDAGDLTLANGLISGTSATTATATVSVYDGSTASSATYSATFVPKQTLTIAISGQTSSETLFYSNVYEQAPSLSFIQGSWRDSQGASLTVTSTGAATAVSSDGCSASGSITPSTTGENFYRVTLTTGNNPACVASGLVMTGVVAQNTATSIVMGLKAGQAGAAFMLNKQ